MKDFFRACLNKKKLLFLLVPAAALLTVFCAQGIPIFVFAEERSSESNITAAYMEQLAASGQAERIMKTLSAAYPQRIGPAVLRDGDWAFLVGDKWFYYAEGRILPEDRRNHVDEYRVMGFNSNYQAELPSWESTTGQRAERTRRFEENRNRPPQPAAPRTETRQLTRRSLYFTEALWNISNRAEAQRQQVEINFLGHRLTVHSGISEKMKQINSIIQNEARTNPMVRQWIDSLGTVTGWNWRNVASSGNRSSHSYGISIDLLPQNLQGKATYWFWEAANNPQWWDIPYTDRYHPPDMVIKTFEYFGFIWGGKWGNFDTMHFEYRPETFIFSNLPLVDFSAEL